MAVNSISANVIVIVLTGLLNFPLLLYACRIIVTCVHRWKIVIEAKKTASNGFAYVIVVHFFTCFLFGGICLGVISR